MLTLPTAADMRRWSDAERRAGRTIGFVPTMGALHHGHASLIRAARTACDRVVVSIFVNPTQFGPTEDFGRYPRTFDADRALCERDGADAVFAPSVEDMYPPGGETFVDVGPLGAVLCGASRPGHFRGVATVVAKLFAIVTPHRAYFGQKDYQQTVVIRRLALDLRLGIDIVVCPTVRDADGLAASSRNAYLTPEERKLALQVPAALAEAGRLIAAGERSGGKIRHALEVFLTNAPGVRVDYAAVVHPDTLQPLERLAGRVVVALAVRVGNTRLIDNGVFEVHDA
ncbi:MAG: pantoate--beta-alanine ligase [Nitrospirota bacterium]